jgi:predicted outer membrane repeat protein
MTARSWFRNLLSRTPRISRKEPARWRPRLEDLEERLAPAVINVISLADNNNPVVTAGHAGTAADPFLAPSLRSAISFTNATPLNNTIHLTQSGTYKLTLAGTAGEAENAAGELAILGKPCGGNLDIQNTSGQAVTVDANQNSRVFDINPNFDPNNPTARPSFTVTLSGFTVTGGVVNDNGGGIRDSGNANLTLISVVVTGNSATFDGGGLYSAGSATLTLTACTVSGNSASVDGGGISIGGGSLTITSSIISHNSTASVTHGGGGLYVNASGTDQVTISGTTFDSNSATGAPSSGLVGGGAIFVDAAARPNITTSTFTNNTVTGANEKGGAILTASGTTTVSFSRFFGNTAATPANGTSVFQNTNATVTANDDWWGQNGGPANHQFVNAAGADITPTSWLQLNIAAGSTTLTSGASTTVTADFLKDSAGNTISTSNLATLIGLPVSWAATGGSLSNQQNNIQSNGAATATYPAGATPGPGSASATVDNTTATVNFTINAAAATHLSVVAPSSATAGSPFSLTVTALDQFNNIATGYTGTVHFTTSDSGSGVAVPATYTFLAADNGVHTFTSGVTLVTAGSQKVTATDTSTSSITGTASVTVNAAAATHLLVSAPSSATAGSPFGVTVTALDQFNNTATRYTGTVHFTKSDSGSGSSVPANYTFVASDIGSHTFTSGVTLATSGPQTLTATDTATATITGTTAINVAAAAGAAAGVEAFVINDGTAQRSMVNSLTVTFTGTVTLDPGTIELFQTGVGPVGGLRLSTATVLAGGISKTQVILTFSNGVSGVSGGSLADGNYQLVVHARGVHFTNGSATPPADYVTTFFRLFGDVNGDRKVDDIDLAAFQQAYRSVNGVRQLPLRGLSSYRWYFDVDQNGVIDAVDYYQFLRRYRNKLNPDGSVTAI